MKKVAIIGLKSSNAYKTILNKTDIKPPDKKSKIDFLINFGLVGNKLSKALSKYKTIIKNAIVLNKHIAPNKYYAVKKVGSAGILIPETKLSLSNSDHLNDWIEKRFHSSGGVGICKAKKRRKLHNKYYQKIINNRIYELRVHAFSWMKRNEWGIQKRLSRSNSIAWNFKQGGYFVTIHNKQQKIYQKVLKLSGNILNLLNMNFGAIDFIVTDTGKIYFIEINSKPGLNGLSDSIYINAFNKLKK